MPILGVILAGGKSRRFGSDKALAVVDGQPLIEHAVLGLQTQVDALVISGRGWRDLPVVEDYPAPDLGPLGGLAGALRRAFAHGFSDVLTLPVDTYPAPSDLSERLGEGPAVFENQYLVGMWPADLMQALAVHLEKGHRSVRSWIAASGCQLVCETGLQLRNINRPEDAS